MKISLPLALTLATAAPLLAAPASPAAPGPTTIYTAPVPAPGPAATIAAPPAPASAPNWLNERGVIDIETLLTSLDAKVSPEQRATLSRALDERNDALHDANARLSAELKKILAVDDTKRANDTDGQRRLDRIKRLQPSRYNEMLRQSQKDQAAAQAKAAANPAPK